MINRKFGKKGGKLVREKKVEKSQGHSTNM
jgi:hypothetical protein